MINFGKQNYFNTNRRKERHRPIVRWSKSDYRLKEQEKTFCLYLARPIEVILNKQGHTSDTFVTTESSGE